MFLPNTQIVADANVEEMSPEASKIAQMQELIGAPKTGRFDEATFNALKQWQANMGLQVTGYPNEATIAALKKMGGEAMGDLTWWDWAIIYLFEYKWVAIGIGIGAIGGIGYWLWRRSKKRRS